MTSQAAKLGLAVLIYALANAAHAGGERTSLLQCGVNLGNKTLGYKPATQEKPARDKRMNHVLAAASSQPIRITTAATAPVDNLALRLPPKLTIATIGCAWL